MSLLDNLSQEDVWKRFYEYKISLACPKEFADELRIFIVERRFVPVCDNIRSGGEFPLPRKSVISKMGSEKKRVVYTYPEEESTVLKLLTWLMLRQYDDIFSRGLYSFRPGRTAKDAVRHILKHKNIKDMYAYKVDIHNYFNSISVSRILPMLKDVLAKDPELYGFLSTLLLEPYVMDRGKKTVERKGIMAGTPVSSFYANLYLRKMDEHFEKENVIYARYSDDIIVFADSMEVLNRHVQYIKEMLLERELEVNPAKESYYEPGDGFTFLGFICQGDKVDIAPATLKKLKQKMKRKRDSLARWAKRNEVDGVNAAKAFIRMFNRKLLESPNDNDLCWGRWFFPVINTTDSLHEIDLYAQDCIRFLVSGRHTKARFNVKYEDIKALGYRSLVHEYYENFEK